MENTGMATATDGLRRHQWSMMSLLAGNLHQPPCCRPHLPLMLSSFSLPLPPLPSPLLPQPPPPPHLAQLPNLAPTSSRIFSTRSSHSRRRALIRVCNARRSSLYPCTICTHWMQPASALAGRDWHLHSPDATGICNASCLYVLASCLDIFSCFGWALHTIPARTLPVFFRLLCGYWRVMGRPRQVWSCGVRLDVTWLVLQLVCEDIGSSLASQYAAGPDALTCCTVDSASSTTLGVWS